MFSCGYGSEIKKLVISFRYHVFLVPKDPNYCIVDNVFDNMSKGVNFALSRLWIDRDSIILHKVNTQGIRFFGGVKVDTIRVKEVCIEPCHDILHKESTSHIEVLSLWKWNTYCHLEDFRVCLVISSSTFYILVFKKLGFVFLSCRECNYPIDKWWILFLFLQI